MASGAATTHTAVIILNEELGISFNRDLLVTRVQADGQGARAKVETGFKLVRVDGVVVKNVVEFQLEKRRAQFHGKDACDFEFKVRSRNLSTNNNKPIIIHDDNNK